METISRRSIFAVAAAILFSLVLFIFVSKSPYIFAVGPAVAAFLAQLTTFKSGVLHGFITAFPPSLYLVVSDSIPEVSSNSLFSGLLNVMLLTGFGGLYCGVIVWLINRLKQGKLFFSWSKGGWRGRRVFVMKPWSSVDGRRIEWIVLTKWNSGIIFMYNWITSLGEASVW